MTPKRVKSNFSNQNSQLFSSEPIIYHQNNISQSITLMGAKADCDCGKIEKLSVSVQPGTKNSITPPKDVAPWGSMLSAKSSGNL
ncbi:MAG: hypothetical protein LBG58_16435 [Planctomycetaceae bacterium]|jgi:hypothetical protein|nr:hypothetical protein [Planctomycetaceae bacterium]